MSEPTFRAIPILRIFDLAKAKEFYVDFLAFRIDWEHLADFQREIAAKSYRFMRPGIEPTAWRSKFMEVIDPCNNRLRLDEHSSSPHDAGWRHACSG